MVLLNWNLWLILIPNTTSKFIKEAALLQDDTWARIYVITPQVQYKLLLTSIVHCCAWHEVNYGIIFVNRNGLSKYGQKLMESPRLSTVDETLLECR